MKKLITILFAAIVLAISCERHEDIWSKLNEHEQRIEKLERQCRELNSNVEALQTILTALQKNDYVTGVMKIVEDGVEVGYSITFAKVGTVSIYHGTDGTDGAAGTTPDISIKKAADGDYYWTSDGEWLTDDSGNKIPAVVPEADGDHITPKFRVADGQWYVSYDNGNSWKIIKGMDEEPFFESVTHDEYNLYLNLSDGTVITIPTKTVAARIHSVTYIPGYADGKARMMYTATAGVISACSATLDYEIRPAELAAELAERWEELLSVGAVYTLTKSTVDYVPLEIENVSASEGVLSVTVSGSELESNYFRGEVSANVRLEIFDGNTSVISEYVNMVPRNEDMNSEAGNSNILEGKILVTICDSITYGADMHMEPTLGYIENPGPDEGKYKSYGWQIANRNNMKFYQKGISGSTMQGAVNPNGTDKGDISKKNGFSKENGRYTQLPDDIDFMTIMFGWNDTAYGTLGTINDTTNETYCGGFNVVLPYLIHKYPYTTIVLIVPFGTTEAHRQAVRDMAQKWGVGCFDMCANDLPFYYSEESDDVAVNAEMKKLRIKLNQVNGAHPGYQGHYAIGTRLEDYLRKCGCYDRANAIFYKVSYSTEHGTAPEPVEKVKVLYSTLFPTLTSEGYTFKGWYMDSEFKTKATAGTVLNSDTTLYAKWKTL